MAFTRSARAEKSDSRPTMSAQIFKASVLLVAVVTSAVFPFRNRLDWPGALDQLKVLWAGTFRGFSWLPGGRPGVRRA